MMDVQFDQAQLDSVHKLLAEVGKDSKPLLVRSLNRTATGARANVVDAIYQKLNTTKKVIRGHSYVTKATRAKLGSGVRFSGKDLALSRFSARQTKKGVSFKIWRDQAREKYRHAFLETMKSGHTGVFERKRESPRYDGRLPLREKKGPSVPDVLDKTPWMLKNAVAGNSQRLAREVDSQLELILSKHKNAV